MPGRDLHSRMVGWLKVSLPLVALILLSTLFLLSDRIDPTDAIPYATVDVEDLANDPRMSSPAYAGTTTDGAGIMLSADAVRPTRSDKGTSAQGVRAEMQTPDGQKVEISAADANLDDAAGQLNLSGGVTLETAAGYRLVTERLMASLDRTNLSSQMPVTVEAPLGDLRADSFTLSQDPANPSAYLLVFNGGVRLLYQPGGQTP